MGIVITAIGPEGAGKSTTVLYTVLAMDKVLSQVYGSTQINPSVLLFDATPEGTISSFCDEKRAADERKLQIGDNVANYTWITKNPEAGGSDVTKANNYDLVIVDTSSQDPEQVDDLLTAADRVILTVSPYDAEEVWSNFIGRAQRSAPSATLEQAVVNRYDPSSDTQRQTHDLLRFLMESSGRSMERWITKLPYSSEVQEACARREAAYMSDRDARTNYGKLARRVLQTTLLAGGVLGSKEQPVSLEELTRAFC